MRRTMAVLLGGFVLLGTAVGAGASVPGKDFTETGCDGYSDSVARLYTAGLDREPERGGFEFWMAEYTAGRWSLPKMAVFFTESPEFQSSYGTLTQDGFIRQLYRNVLGREGEPGGVAFWNSQMDQGMTRGTVLLRFAESPENIENSGTTQPILGPFNAGLTGPWTCVGSVPASPGDTKNCSDFATQSEAQQWFDTYYPYYGDIAKLDGDNNGIPCESLVAGPVVAPAQPAPEPVAPVPGPAPAPTPLPQPVAPAPEPVAPTPTPEPSPTASQRQAIDKALSYLRFSSFSRSGLIDQLEFEGFSTADSTFAVDYLEIDFNEQAVKKAASYLRFSAFSRLGLIDQLEFEGFTTAQATHGTDAQGTDYNRQAELKAASYLRVTSFSCQGLIDQLVFEKFTLLQARHGANSTGIC